MAIRCFNFREKAVAAPRPRRGRGAGTGDEGEKVVKV